MLKIVFPILQDFMKIPWFEGLLMSSKAYKMGNILEIIQERKRSYLSK
jgi:hypothetical protein